MQWSDISFTPSSRTLRQFAGLAILFVVGLALWQGLARGNLLLAVAFAVAALTIGPVGLLFPQAVRPIYVGWMILAFPIGWTVAILALALLYFGLFTPLAFLFRLMGRDALERKPRPEQETYWTAKPAAVDAASYFRQF